MVDCTGKNIVVGFVVEISGAWSKDDNGFWLVDEIWTDHSVHLHRLNNDMSKSKRETGATRNWPLRCYHNDRFKRNQINEYNKANAKIQVLCPWVEPQKKVKPKSNEMRILKNGIRKGESYCPCYYWKNNDGSITVYSKHYNTHLPSELGNIRNNTDIMTDYFDKDSCLVTADNPYHAVILKKVFGE